MKSMLLIVGLFLSTGPFVHAQVAGTGSAPSAPTRPVTIVQSSGSPAPQVVTVVHRLSGMKVLSLLHRDGQSPMVVDDEFLTTREMLTSVTAGFALGDGKSVVARLPQAEAEFQFSFSWPAMTAPPAPFTLGATPATPALPPVAAPAVPKLPELLVIQRDGSPRAARYIGLDAGTGLSLIQIEGLNAAPLRDAIEEQLVAGQRVRLLAPQRINETAGSASAATTSKLYLAVSEIEGNITALKRSSSGKLAHLIVSALKLNSTFAGGIAINDAGETIGIVETSDANEASVMPMTIVRRAAERVLERRGNVPQPWLGIRGRALAATSLAQLLSRGWSQDEAALLQSKRSGILLTEVAPNTPAALANLRSGDVIVRLNEAEVKNVEDFSFMLKEAGIGATVNFTVLRRDQLMSLPPAAAPTPMPRAVVPPGQIKPLIVSVKLSESLKPIRSTWEWETKARDTTATDPLSAAGIESIPLSPKAAARLGANGGLLVVFVNQESAAARAGLHVFDIIESINGKLLSPSNVATLFNSTNARPQTFVVVREGKKFSISFPTQVPKKQ